MVIEMEENEESRRIAELLEKVDELVEEIIDYIKEARGF